MEAAPAVTLTLTAGSAVPVIGAVVNAASFADGMAPGSLATLFGANLGGATVTLNGVDVHPFYASESQINFYIPADTPLGANVITVTGPSALAATATVNLVPAQPGIFSGAVVHADTGASALTIPVKAGDFIAIYCTGLGPTRVSRQSHHHHAHRLSGRHGGVSLVQRPVQLCRTLSGERADSCRTALRHAAARDRKRQHLQQRSQNRGAMMLSWLFSDPLPVGADAPEFSAADDSGRNVTLSALRGKYVVLVFYPGDDTPGCTKQLCQFRDDWSAGESASASQVFGVNPQNARHHSNFRKKFQFPFPLLVDERQKIAQAYHAHGLIVKRTVYLISREGNILFAQRGMPSPSELLALAKA